ncbi:Scr1 family TA system antitoxin-like transcriptional regulator [Actinosynnema sp. CS-041913]|uniref:DUF397 domain-containing protein n=1 Tax=Actinosynnema sp. CS-041913 TaxID=3239917 RepID=UPI003D92EBFC
MAGVAAETEVTTIFGALGVVRAKRRELLAPAREAAKSNWLATGSGLPQQLKALIEYERVAASITDVTSLVIPGLLQTPDYMRAIMAEGGLPHAEAEERLRLRLDRQRVFTRENPMRYLAVIDKFVLRRPVGGRSVIKSVARQAPGRAGLCRHEAHAVGGDRERRGLRGLDREVCRAFGRARDVTTWRKSSRSTTETNCVEVAVGRQRVALRDSKNRTGPVLGFPAASAESFLAWLKQA